MGRSSINAPTFRFKKQFCPNEHPIYWYTWPFYEKSFFKAEETLSINFWKKMPLGVANLFGPLVRKRISL